MDLVDVIKDVEMRNQHVWYTDTLGTRVRTLNGRGLLQELTTYSVWLAFLICNFHANFDDLNDLTGIKCCIYTEQRGNAECDGN